MKPVFFFGASSLFAFSLCLSAGCNSSSVSESADSKTVDQLVSETDRDAQAPLPVIRVKHPVSTKSTDAQIVLANALEQAKSEGKNVFVHFGTPGCGWCRKLENFLDSNRPLFADDYVMTKIDIAEMEHGSDVLNKYKQNQFGGTPWIVILSPAGKPLVTSDGPLGNCGCPMEPLEISYFVNMIKSTCDTPSQSKLIGIRDALTAFAKKSITGR